MKKLRRFLVFRATKTRAQNKKMRKVPELSKIFFVKHSTATLWNIQALTLIILM